jgi:hypothetical protein
MAENLQAVRFSLVTVRSSYGVPKAIKEIAVIAFQI